MVNNYKKKLQIISIKEMQKNLQKIFPYKNIVEGEKNNLKPIIKYTFT